MAGEKFIKSDTTDIIKRIEANITNYLKDNA